ncbi:G-type lectin S-receptor-like serine/threonine-protein kinase At1g11330 isoform X1 [Olea europaea var. sylvestris]|uniref:G-type lectin S-receptor-like serine/threonine-protein kinase At1g11330 isoform X1 n=1 Tax=Olea europaea var. sylvestris TaxID=158386 RepID=UPI000C1D51F2|nr:G-type lectin S-receptor-like serine/threonine-protein kinase At1g11330 isoform X1 [Olea europaea var. sylvestris]
MITGKSLNSLVLCILVVLYRCPLFCTSRDNITANLVIKDPETLVSKGKHFKLGFFSPFNNSSRYLGIWYNQNVSEPTVVWVANRDKALNDSSGTVKIYKDGNIVVMSGDKEILWSSNIKNATMNTAAQLLDSGNLVLIESSSGRKIWESFKQPSGSFLAAMKISRSINGVEKATTSCGNGTCGPFGICDSQNSPICACLEGFNPKDDGEWKAENWTSGCVRRIHLQCETNNGSNGGGKEDRFLKLKMMKFPDNGDRLPGQESECEGLCMKNCSCKAYAHDVGTGCLFWTGSLINIQKFSAGSDLFIRLANSDVGHKKVFKLVIIIMGFDGLISISIIIFFSRKFMAKPRGSTMTSEHGDISNASIEELPVFKFEMLANATDNFHDAKKLGTGGFGPVYKGQLANGREIAIKRLSKVSTQGMKEFMNEVKLISKLKHRNLVRLLGCSVERGEKMLVYEYMPNKSLDAHLFGPSQEILDWRLRFNIIEGIGRGLLYLHRDSRLRIVHRDLKPSNILLDNDWNPKISDFGMARIFEGNQDHASTVIVAGTYGYMAPEYAMKGIFSEKSDVFSFGVLMLEIVSGRRNTSFCEDESSLSLLEYAWKRWNEDDVVALIDARILSPSYRAEIMRCIHIGLLCVQKLPKDRPNISVVLSMLSSEIVELPEPKQTAFTESSQQRQKRSISLNNVTLTEVDAR